jgi:hypothetical protein
MRTKKTEIDQEKLWTPVRRGKTYCSSACGSGCTVREHQRAVRDADALVKKLRGTGWRAVVWENLGWHFRAVSGPVQVYGNRCGPRGILRYSCLISDQLEVSVGGSVLWTTKDKFHSDPNQAVEHELRSAHEALLRIGSVVLVATRVTGTQRVFLERVASLAARDGDKSLVRLLDSAKAKI